MKLSTLALTMATLFTSATVFAGNLHFSENIEILALDGQKIKKSFLKKAKDISFDAGQHQLVIRVSEIIKDGSEQQLFESDPIIIRFNATQEDISILTPRLENKNDVNSFKKHPKLHFKTQSGETLNIQHDWLPQEGFLPNNNLIEQIMEYNATNGKAVVNTLATQPMKTLTPAQKIQPQSAKSKVVVNGENIAEQQLQYWFQQADHATKKRFLNWAKSQ